jgi:DeoR family transcriptional regulator of aga operon
VIANVNIQEVPIKQAMINAADKVILLTDSSKFGNAGFAKVCDITDCDHIVTDEGLTREYIEFIKGKNVDLIIA